MIKALVNKEILYASDAKSGQLGECPHCGKPVRARCGEINIEHWAHLDDDCPYITEKDTSWHIAWKNKFKKKDYLIEVKFGNYICDAYNPVKNNVIEFQHSFMTPKEISDKNKYYESINKNIIWIFDYTNKYEKRHIELTEKNVKKENEYYYDFKIKWQKKSWMLGIFNSNFSNVLAYCNIIYNYNNQNYTKLRVIKNFEDYQNKKYINRYRNYLANLNNSLFTNELHYESVLAELYYNSNNVLLKINKIDNKGKNGSGEFVFD